MKLDRQSRRLRQALTAGSLTAALLVPMALVAPAASAATTTPVAAAALRQIETNPIIASIWQTPPEPVTNDFGTLSVSVAPRDYEDLGNPHRRLFVNYIVKTGFIPAGAITYVTGDAEINGNGTRWHMGKVVPAGYSVHGTLGRYQNNGDAPWTDHYLSSGDTIDLTITTVADTGEKTAQYVTVIIE